MVWTHFMDMHSGGGRKLEWEDIYIEAPLEEAKRVFYAKTGRNPDRVTCTCCGNDYLATEGTDSLEELTAHERGCKFMYYTPEGEAVGESTLIGGPVGWREVKERNLQGRYLEEPASKLMFRARLRGFNSLKEFIRLPDVKVIPASEITDDERHAEIPEQGYVWVDP